MKEMTVTSLQRLLQNAISGYDGIHFHYQQNKQNDSAFLSRTRLSMRFDRLLVTPAAQAVHLLNGSGSFTIENIKNVLVDDVEHLSERGWIDIIFVCGDGEQHKIVCER